MLEGSCAQVHSPYDALRLLPLSLKALRSCKSYSKQHQVQRQLTCQAGPHVLTTLVTTCLYRYYTHPPCIGPEPRSGERVRVIRASSHSGNIRLVTACGPQRRFQNSSIGSRP